MATANLFAQSLTNVVYETEFINRKMNVGGALHSVVSRSKMRHALDTYTGTSLTPAKGALQGALLARTLCAPLTMGIDAMLGTGRTHFAPGELPDFKPGQSMLSYEYELFRGETDKFSKANHHDRVVWLQNRVGQTLEHPCDTGLLGVIAGASSLPMLFIASAVTAAAGAIVGTMAYGVQRLSGTKDITYPGVVNNVPTWFGGVPAMLARSIVPMVSISFNVLTRIGILSIDLADLMLMYAILQSVRITTAALKIAITAVGACVGACVGAGASLYRATRPDRALAAPDAGGLAHLTGLADTAQAPAQTSLDAPEVPAAPDVFDAIAAPAPASLAQGAMMGVWPLYSLLWGNRPSFAVT